MDMGETREPMPGWGWGGDPWAGLGWAGGVWPCAEQTMTTTSMLVSLALRSSYHSLSHGCDATNPRLKSVNPSFCLPVPSRARRLPRMPSTTPKQATRTHTHTHKPRMFSSPSHARPSFANPCMQASSPHPALRPRLAMYNWSAPTWTVCRGCNQGRRLVRGRGWLHRIGKLSEWAEHRQQRRRARLISQRH